MPVKKKIQTKVNVDDIARMIYPEYAAMCQKKGWQNLYFNGIRKFIGESNLEIANHIVTEKTGFKIPEVLGLWVVSHIKLTKLYELKKIKSSGHSVFVKLYNTDGHLSKLLWIKPSSNRKLSNQCIYQFIDYKHIKRKYKKVSKDGAEYMSKQDIKEYVRSVLKPLSKAEYQSKNLAEKVAIKKYRKETRTAKT